MKPVYLPIRVVSSLNAREHWSKRAKRAKQERNIVYMACGVHWTTFGWPELPTTVLLTRIAPRPYDGDNLQASFKGVRDGVADRLGVNDGGDLVRWKYAQRRGKPKEYAVEIEITSGQSTQP